MGNIEGVTSVIAVGSCKGGVGKTTVSVNLAMALRRTGSEVGLFDGDLYGPNIPLMLGLRTQKSNTPFHFQNKTTGDSAPFIPLYSSEKKRTVDPVLKFGINVMSLGLWFSEKEVARDSSYLGGVLINQVLSQIKWPDLDFLIIDLPPGTGPLLAAITAHCGVDGMLLVTTPQDMTLLDSGRSLELFRTLKIDVLGRIENMSYLLCPECGERVDVFSTGYDDWSVLQDLDLVGTIPLDHRYAKPIDAYHPFTQVEVHSKETEPFLTIAERVRNLLPD